MVIAVVDIDYEKMNNSINEFGKNVLHCIKIQYGSSLTQAQLEHIDRLLETDFIVVEKPNDEDIEFFSKQDGITNPSKYSIKYVPSAHGGRTKGDDKIHIYPYTKSFSKCTSFEEIIKQCFDDIVVHEIFHYFIRPDLSFQNNENVDVVKEEFGHFLTEGLVQYYAEKFANNNGLVNPKSNYNKNVVFVQKLLSSFPTEQVDRCVFTCNQDELLSISESGSTMYREYVANYNFKEKISSFIIDISKKVDLKDDVSGVIKHLQKMDDIKDVEQLCERGINEIFRDNVELKNSYLNDLYVIIASSCKELEDIQTNSIKKM